MGDYKTPCDEFDRPSYDMWRASRPVIDTGIMRRGGAGSRRSTFSPALLAEGDLPLDILRARIDASGSQRE